MTGPAVISAPARPAPLARRRADIALIDSLELLAATTALADRRYRGALFTPGLPSEEVSRQRRALLRPRSVRRPLHPLLDHAAKTESLTVADYRGKDRAVEQVSRFASHRGLPPRSLAALEQAVDELLLNALLHAPRDEAGRPRYQGLEPRRLLYVVAPPGEHAEVRFASDESRVVVAVRDRFGALRRSTVLAYLESCARAQQARRSPIEEKPGGAGVGLFLAADAASELFFYLRSGRLTEVVCVLYFACARPLRAIVVDDE